MGGMQQQQQQASSAVAGAVPAVVGGLAQQQQQQMGAGGMQQQQQQAAAAVGAPVVGVVSAPGTYVVQETIHQQEYIDPRYGPQPGYIDGRGTYGPNPYGHGYGPAYGGGGIHLFLLIIAANVIHILFS